MKATFLCVLTTVYSAVLMGELPQQTAALPSPTPASFCGQPEMVSWFLNTEIGRQLQQRQQEALAQALAEHEIVELPKPNTSQK